MRCNNMSEIKFIITEREIINSVKCAVEFNIREQRIVDILMRDITEELEVVLYDECMQETETGHWNIVSNGYGENLYLCECSECKDTVWVYKDKEREWNYCPNCGCKMKK